MAATPQTLESELEQARGRSREMQEETRRARGDARWHVDTHTQLLQKLHQDLNQVLYEWHASTNTMLKHMSCSPNETCPMNPVSIGGCFLHSPVTRTSTSYYYRLAQSWILTHTLVLWDISPVPQQGFRVCWFLNHTWECARATIHERC